jgi:hypothetical protein
MFLDTATLQAMLREELSAQGSGTAGALARHVHRTSTLLFQVEAHACQHLPCLDRGEILANCLADHLIWPQRRRMRAVSVCPSRRQTV